MNKILNGLQKALLFVAKIVLAAPVVLVLLMALLCEAIPKLYKDARKTFHAALYKIIGFSKAKAKDNVFIEHRAADGSLIKKFALSNLITNAGLAGISDILGPQGSTAAYDYIALGTGTTAAAATDTALETETAATGLARAQGTASRVTTTVANDTLQVAYTFTNSSGGSVAVTEYGLLNAASSGTLMARVVQAATNVANGESLSVTWKIDFS